MEFPHLFDPFEINGHRFKNRLFSAPIQTSHLDGNGYYTEYAVQLFSEKAKGGCALVSLGDTPVDSRYAVSTYRHPVVDDPGTLPTFSELIRSVHEYGAMISVELNHAGSVANTAYITGPEPIGPVDFVRKDGCLVRGMTPDLIEYTLESYAQAAALSKLADVDVITIQAGHGWLLHQFLSPGANTRTDRYGGNLRNRCRFPLEVLARVRQTVGPDTLIQLGVSATEHGSGGHTIEDTIEFVKLAQPYVDLVYVSDSINTNSRASTYVHPTPYQKHCIHADAAAQIRAAVNLPVVAVGSILYPDEAEQILSEGKADAVAMGRALIADPYLPYKAKHGWPKEIRPCIRCLNCLDDMSRSRSFSCTVNPIAGREFRLNQKISRAPRQFDMAVVGGGPAGMSAALAATDAGHRVTLYEKEELLGGMIRKTVSGRHHADTAAYINYLKQRVRGTEEITIVTGTEVTPELIRQRGYEALILATGSLPDTDDIVGADLPCCIDAQDVYWHEEEVGEKVLIIGGGVAGCEAGFFLSQKGHDVMILDRNALPMESYSRLPRIKLIDRMMQFGVKLRAMSEVTEITGEGVSVRNHDGQILHMTADTVVIACGRRPDMQIYRDYRDAAPIVTVVGGARTAGSLYDCVHSGYFAGRNLEYY